ncbi:TIR domain-containing protein [Cryptosporangium sp. NPDC051539]|uniref:TIR domain-containing protein n=1 Tax=Cryptosporangium sp. NPDC051539 TaxID=3363962 RepID=UPI00379BE9CF
MDRSVFLSYSRRDRPYVEKLAALLAAAGVAAWWDFDLAVGDAFPDELQDRIDACAAFVVVLSPDAVSSAWVKNELHYALERGKRILPLMLAPCRVPLQLVSLHREDVTGGRLPGARFVDELRGLTAPDARAPGTQLPGTQLPGTQAPDAWAPDTWALAGGHAAAVRLAFSPDGRMLAAGDNDATVRLFDAAATRLVGPPLQGCGTSVGAVAFTPDGRRLLGVGWDGSLCRWDVTDPENPREAGPPHSCGGSLYSAVFDRDATYLATGGQDDRLSVWDTTTGRRVAGPIVDGFPHLSALALSPDGRFAAAGGMDPCTRLWDLRTGLFLRMHTGNHLGTGTCLAFSPDGRLVAAGSLDGLVRLWDVPGNHPAGAPLTGHEGTIGALAFSPDGRYLVSGGHDGTVRWWDRGTGRQIALVRTGEAVFSCAFRPDGRLLATGGMDPVVRLWTTPASRGAGAPRDA